MKTTRATIIDQAELNELRAGIARLIEAVDAQSQQHQQQRHPGPQWERILGLPTVEQMFSPGYWAGAIAGTTVTMMTMLMPELPAMSALRAPR